MSATHTPGPWTLDTNLHIYGTSAPRALKSEYVRDGTITEQPHVATATSFANARLIAKAPQLATALREFTLLTDEGDDAAHSVYIAKDGRVRCKGSLLAAIEAARALLADLPPTR